MKHSYPVKIDKENMGYSTGFSIGISTKMSIEIANMIRGVKVERAKKDLKEVIDMKKAVPLTRFNGDVGHKKGMGPGRFPLKAATMILQLVESAESNALDKGLNTSNLTITHISANRAAQQWRYGRHRRRKAKRTHVQIVVQEKGSAEAPKPKKAETKDEVKTKEAPKKDEKKVEKEVKKEKTEKKEAEKPKTDEKKAQEKKPEKIEEKKPEKKESEVKKEKKEEPVKSKEKKPVKKDIKPKDQEENKK